MKKFALFFFILFSFSQLKAQSKVTDKQWSQLAAYLDAEQWQKAAQLSKSYLVKIPRSKTNADDAATLRYMYIIAQAGLMNAKQLTKEKAIKNVTPFTGRNIVLASHPITLKE